MGNFNSNVEVSNSTQELNKGHLPDPGWTRREQNKANEAEVNQVVAQENISTGGHNPKNPDGDFKPNNTNPSTVLKAVAAGTAVGVVIEQISGGQDARKNEKNSKKGTKLPQPSKEKEEHKKK